LVPADSFGENEFPFQKMLRYFLQDALDAGCIMSCDLTGSRCPVPNRTTLKATDGLRVKPTVVGILVFLFATIAKGIGCHRGTASIKRT
jgi:hypothetical protein